MPRPDRPVEREWLARILHDANTGRITPDDTDPTKYAAMADAVLDSDWLQQRDAARAELAQRGEVVGWVVVHLTDDDMTIVGTIVPPDEDEVIEVAARKQHAIDVLGGTDRYLAAEVRALAGEDE